ncbi:MAG: hypothetical protein Q8N14_05965 [Candidatus Omnitrophota bacterium]|nr:hypothetical protein [Candidatus Omnitrophota bacterium]
MNFKIIKLPIKAKNDLLACGADLKNTFALVSGDKMYVSSINGDLQNLDNFLEYERNIGAAIKGLNIRPRLICCDLHPEYFSSKFAVSLAKKHKLPVEFIQHHHGHVASCMFENGETGKGIGIAFDGTGYGTDGSIWGAEFLKFDYKNFKRLVQLKYIPLAGGDKAILEPWRLTATWLYSIYKDKLLDLKIDFIKKMSRKKWLVIKQMLDKDINSPLSSSMGRLFDAVSALIGLKDVVEYEAQAAIELEQKASQFYPQDLASYKFRIEKRDNLIINPEAIFPQIIADLKNKEEIGKIALKFHYTIAVMIKEACLLIRKKEGLNKVFLSGGVFQNKILTEKAVELLKKAGFQIFIHLTSPNDSCISIGQAIIGINRRPRN